MPLLVKKAWLKLVQHFYGQNPSLDLDASGIQSWLRDFVLQATNDSEGEKPFTQVLRLLKNVIFCPPIGTQLLDS